VVVVLGTGHQTATKTLDSVQIAARGRAKTARATRTALARADYGTACHDGTAAAAPVVLTTLAGDACVKYLNKLDCSRGVSTEAGAAFRPVENPCHGSAAKHKNLSTSRNDERLHVSAEGSASAHGA
jgi:hypothetical protein